MAYPCTRTITGEVCIGPTTYASASFGHVLSLFSFSLAFTVAVSTSSSFPFVIPVATNCPVYAVFVFLSACSIYSPVYLLVALWTSHPSAWLSRSSFRDDMSNKHMETDSFSLGK